MDVNHKFRLGIMAGLLSLGGAGVFAILGYSEVANIIAIFAYVSFLLGVLLALVQFTRRDAGSERESDSSELTKPDDLKNREIVRTQYPGFLEVMDCESWAKPSCSGSVINRILFGKVR